MNSIAPDKIKELVEKFTLHHESYLNHSYNETQLRREFLDPFFKALGWDVDNEAGYAEAYKEVIHEDALRIGNLTKAPDYCFRVGGVRKFFVEAKKPSVNIKTDLAPAYQLRRYAWSAKLPISILTDFEELVIYESKSRPYPSDSASKYRIGYFKYTDYISKWDEIYAIFSKEAILKGSFDKYVSDATTKRGTTEVDDEFLKEIERWRELIAKDLARNNQELTVRDLNYSVQKTIDRIIFLRICEDRGIENNGRLQSLLNRSRVYPALAEMFEEADRKYNSGLFHFRTEKDVSESPDTLTLKLQISDEALKEIIKNLYYPDSPYEFSVLPADTLGQVYEQFLGKVIRLTDGHRAVIEDKPEVKKAGGVYYTPTYIVDYIVKNTVGKLLEKKTPKQVEKLKVLDPACGSGTFLLQAYQSLLDWHRDYYVSHNPKKYAQGKHPVIYQKAQNDWRLTLAERRRILLNNIHGVDIDSQAVEVTKLSLLLKLLEGQIQMLLPGQRILPDLGKNIKCGNSLIGPDIYAQQQMGMFGTEDQYRINAFDWQSEFKDVMDSSGFDAVIGNPPYGAFFSGIEMSYLRHKYTNATYQVDSYPIFIEKSIFLLKEKGKCGIIVPTAWVASNFNALLRKMLLEETAIENILIAPKSTFKNATVETLIIIFNNHKVSKNTFEVSRWDKEIRNPYKISQHLLVQSKEFIFPIYSEPEINEIILKLSKLNKLEEYVEAVWGVKIYQKGKGEPKQKGYESDNKIFHSKEKSKISHKALLGGKDIQRYKLNWSGMYVDYGKWLAEPRSENWFVGPRILIREVTAKGIIQATLVTDEYVFSNSVDGVKVKPNIPIAVELVLGITNSKLISFYHLNTSANAFKGSFPKVLIKDILNFPVPKFGNDTQNLHDHIAQLVKVMLELNRKLPAAATDHDRTLIQRQITATDQQIDQLVYELYGLTEEEIKIVKEQKP